MTSTTVTLGVGSSSLPSLYFGSSITSGLFAPANNTLALSTNGTQRLTVDGSGHIGMGTGSATLSNILTVNGTMQINNAAGNVTALSVDSAGNTTVGNLTLSGNLAFAHRFGDISMGAYGNSGD